MNEISPTFRFAPSPNGHLHLGHAYSALLNLKMAREINGRSLLRIEDIDTDRCTPELETQMMDDLEWIGFEWDQRARRQSEHMTEYQDVVQALLKTELLYPSTTSRSRAKQMVAGKEKTHGEWPKDPEGAPIYPGIEREFSKEQREKILASNLPYNLRLDMRRALEHVGEPLNWEETGPDQTGTIIAEPAAWGDIIIARKDTPTSYSLCCVLDDALQKITNVVRGKDLFHTTSIHVLLQKLMRLPSPVYHHHDLILDEGGNKLSKSIKSMGLRALRDAGHSPDELRARLFDQEE